MHKCVYCVGYYFQAVKKKKKKKKDYKQKREKISQYVYNNGIRRYISNIHETIIKKKTL